MNIVDVSIGLETVPEPLEQGDRLFGATVEEVHRTLRFLVVATNDPQRVIDRALADDRVRYAHPVRVLEAASVPSDPLYGDQYGPQRIHLPSAWETTRGRMLHKICITDTGMRTSHEDFSQTRFFGASDFIDGELPAQDARGHGTHVAGIAAASVNNGKGIAGVGNFGLLVARMLDGNGTGSSVAGASSIKWCVDNGADIVSMSWGSRRPSGTIQDAIEYAHDRGALLVAAAMNHGCAECIGWPARFPEVIAVTCTTRSNEVCDFSNTGMDAELSAPGNKILSTWNTADNAYIRISGTSMSTPLVSGVAALVWNVVPELTRDQLRTLLQSSADDLGEPGRDAKYGYGLVNASRTLTRAMDLVGNQVCLVSEPSPSSALAGESQVTVRASDPAGLDRVSLFLDGKRVGGHEGSLPAGEVTFDVPTRHLADGHHHLDARCEAADGTERTVPSLQATDNLDASVTAPSPGTTVAGKAQVVVKASTTRAGLASVHVSVDNGRWVNVTENRTTGGFTFGWSSRTHQNEDQPATIRARVLDAGGFEHETLPTMVKVDNKPDPTVSILKPENGTDVVARQHVVVQAGDAAQPGFHVQVRANNGPWVDITDNRTGNKYHYNWTTLGTREDSTLHARVASYNGSDTATTNVTVYGADTVGQALASAPCSNTLSDSTPSPSSQCPSQPIQLGGDRRTGTDSE